MVLLGLCLSCEKKKQDAALRVPRGCEWVAAEAYD